MTTLNRRNMLTAGAAGLLGLAGAGSAAASMAQCAECDHYLDLTTLGAEARTETDFKNLANLSRLAKRAAEKRAEAYNNVADRFRKNRVPGLTEGQSWDAARALEHVAGHQADVAEALDHLIETFEGLAEPYSG